MKSSKLILGLAVATAIVGVSIPAYIYHEKEVDKSKQNSTTGWYQSNGSWYYNDSNGQMATGFINLGDDAVYYLDPTQGNLVTGWNNIQHNNIRGVGKHQEWQICNASVSKTVCLEHGAD